MATTFDKASLVMIPSGVKEDKLYSIKPTDGSGDFTFSRGSDIQATRVNSSGLIEKAKVNNILHSNDFTNAAWIKSNTNVTGGQTDPNGGSDAALFQNTATANVYVFQAKTGGGTISVYAKAGTRSTFVLLNGNFNNGASFDLSTETTSTAGAGVISKIEDVGSGWYRCSVYVTSKSHFLIGLSNISGGGAVIGDNMIFAFPQENHGLVAQEYIETTTTAVVEGLTADLPRLDYSGGATCPSLLLEPSRSNVLQNSEYFSGSDWINNGVTITDNAAISPEGKTNAALLTGVSGGFGIVKFSTWTATNKVASCFAKAGSGDIFKIANVSFSNRYVLFDLSDGTISEESASWTGSIEDFGNGWYRCTAISNNETGTFSLGTTSSSDSVYIYGAQLESGGYPTSYIPTYGTAAVRGKDSANTTGVSSLIGSTEGTIYLEVSALANDLNERRFALSDGTTGNVARVGFTNISNLILAVLYNGSNQCVLSYAGADITQTNKIAFTYAANDFALYVNGESRSTDISGTTFAANTLDEVHFNEGDGNGNESYGNFDQVLLFKTRLTNAELVALTTI